MSEYLEEGPGMAGSRLRPHFGPRTGNHEGRSRPLGLDLLDQRKRTVVGGTVDVRETYYGYNVWCSIESRDDEFHTGCPVVVAVVGLDRSLRLRPRSGVVLS